MGFGYDFCDIILRQDSRSKGPRRPGGEGVSRDPGSPYTRFLRNFTYLTLGTLV